MFVCLLVHSQWETPGRYNRGDRVLISVHKKSDRLQQIHGIVEARVDEWTYLLNVTTEMAPQLENMVLIPATHFDIIPTMPMLFPDTVVLPNVLDVLRSTTESCAKKDCFNIKNCGLHECFNCHG